MKGRDRAGERLTLVDERFELLFCAEARSRRADALACALRTRAMIGGHVIFSVVVRTVKRQYGMVRAAEAGHYRHFRRTLRAYSHSQAAPRTPLESPYPRARDA